MKVKDVKINEWYLINGRKLKVIDNVNYSSVVKPYLLLQGEIGGILKMYHDSIHKINPMLIPGVLTIRTYMGEEVKDEYIGLLDYYEYIEEIESQLSGIIFISKAEEIKLANLRFILENILTYLDKLAKDKLLYNNKEVE